VRRAGDEDALQARVTFDGVAVGETQNAAPPAVVGDQHDVGEDPLVGVGQRHLAPRSVERPQPRDAAQGPVGQPQQPLADEAGDEQTQHVDGGDGQRRPQERHVHADDGPGLGVDVPEDEEGDRDGDGGQRAGHQLVAQVGPQLGSEAAHSASLDAQNVRGAKTAPAGGQATSSVPAVPGAASAAAISPGATMCTAPTPAARGANASSSLGIIPPCTVPSAMAARASATVRRARRVRGSSLSRRTPPTAVQATSAWAPTAAASWLATTSALMFSTSPEAPPPKQASTGSAPAPSSASSTVPSNPSTSPTKPKSTSAPSDPDTARGGRRWARTTPLDPDRPTAGTPAPRRAPTRSTFRRPATTILTTSSAASSVMRRPPTSRGS